MKRKGQKRKRQPDEQKQEEGHSKPKQRRGGGAWRAFLAEAAKGVKLDKAALGLLSRRYHELSHDEFQRYSEIGSVAKLVARAGVERPFAPRNSDPSSSTTTLAVTSHAVRDLMKMPTHELVVALDGEDFESRLSSFKKALNMELVAMRKQKTLAAEEDNRLLMKARDISKKNCSGMEHLLSMEGGQWVLCQFHTSCDITLWIATFDLETSCTEVREGLGFFNLFH